MLCSGPKRWRENICIWYAIFHWFMQFVDVDTIPFSFNFPNWIELNWWWFSETFFNSFFFPFIHFHFHSTTIHVFASHYWLAYILLIKFEKYCLKQSEKKTNRIHIQFMSIYLYLIDVYSSEKNDDIAWSGVHFDFRQNCGVDFFFQYNIWNISVYQFKISFTHGNYFCIRISIDLMLY